MITKLDSRCKKAVFNIEDIVNEMNLKLNHIIETQKEARYSSYKMYPELYYQAYQ